MKRRSALEFEDHLSLAASLDDGHKAIVALLAKLDRKKLKVRILDKTLAAERALWEVRCSLDTVMATEIGSDRRTSPSPYFEINKWESDRFEKNSAGQRDEPQGHSAGG